MNGGGELSEKQGLARLHRKVFADKVSLRAIATGTFVYRGFENPADRDFLAIGDRLDVHNLIAQGWEVGGSFEEDEFDECWPENRQFVSLRKENENVILTNSETFVLRWLDAHDECIDRAPQTKQDRIRVFRRHLYNEGAGDIAIDECGCIGVVTEVCGGVCHGYRIDFHGRGELLQRWMSARPVVLGNIYAMKKSHDETLASHVSED